MQTEAKYLDLPKLTNGSHFSSYLACPLRAWYDYYGQSLIRAEDPAYLKALFAEGNLFESKVYKKAVYKDSVYIPKRLKQSQKIDITTEEIKKKKHKYIFQAFFKNNEAIGIADILERDDDGVYHVGDIKASKEVSISYVMQIMWYTELLQIIQEKEINDGFIILGNEERVKIDFPLCRDLYEDVKGKLLSIREIKPNQINNAIPPQLSKNCYSCPWRYECMKEINEIEDLSLINGLSRTKIQSLKKNGIKSWRDIECKSHKELSSLDFNDREIELIEKQIPYLNNGFFVLKEKLSAESIEQLIPVCLDRLKPERRLPEKVYYSNNGEINSIEIIEADGKVKMEVPDLLKSSKLALFGADYDEFKKVLKYCNNRLKIVDIFGLLEQYLHAPFYDIDLISVDYYIRTRNQKSLKSEEELNPEPRITALKNVLNFIRDCSKPK